MSDLTLAQGAADRPPWARTFLTAFQSGVAHAFILHRNVTDYVLPGTPLPAYLAHHLLGNTSIVATYNRAAGITFPTPSHRARAMAIWGLDQPKAASGNPMLAALAAAGGGGSGPGDAPALPRAPGAALPLLEQLLHADIPGHTAVILDFAETLVPAADIATMGADDRAALITLLAWGRDPVISALGNPVILITSTLTDIAPAVRAASSKYEAISVPMPGEADRLRYIQGWEARRQAQWGLPASITWVMNPAALARATAGLTCIHIEDILLRASQEGALTRDLVKARKDGIIASEFADVLELYDPVAGLDTIGGLAHVKTFFERSVIAALAQGNLRRVPQGVLMLGPPGCGKTALAKALAYDAGVNFVILNLARIFQGLVGASERNLEKALAAIEALAPTIVFIDEIDQAIARGGTGDSGVSNRIFKRVLEFMSDTRLRGRVLFLAASNRPDLIDPAMMRSGRFDKKVVFTVPDRADRAAIWRVQIGRVFAQAAAGWEAPEDVLDGSDAWTGADIEAAATKAMEVWDDGEAADLTAAVRRAVRALRPDTQAAQWMQGLALQAVNDLDLLPPALADLRGDRAALDATVQANAPAIERRSRDALG